MDATIYRSKLITFSPCYLCYYMNKYIYIYIREKQIFLTANKHQIKDERESDHPPKRTEKNSELQLRIKFTTLQVLLSYWNSMQVESTHASFLTHF